MAKRRYVNTRFWSDSYIESLDPTEKLLFLYLITNERTNIAGVYECPLRYIAVETGIDKEMVERVLKRFEEAEKVYYIDGWIYVRNFAKHQNVANSKIVAGIRRELESVPKEIQLKIRDIDKSSMSNGCLSIYLDLDSDLDSDLDLNATQEEERRRFFNVFWEAYPRKERKKTAREVFQRKRIDEPTLKQILLFIEKARQTDRWTKDEGQYIPHAPTFLNQERWQDDLSSYGQKSEVKTYKTDDFSYGKN